MSSPGTVISGLSGSTSNTSGKSNANVAPATTGGSYSNSANNTQPLRSSLENLGYSVNWQGNNLPISVSKNGQSYNINPGQYTLNNGVAQVSPETLSQITGYVPVRSTLEGLGNEVGWNQSTGEVTASNPLDYTDYSFKPDANWGGTTYADPDRLNTIQQRLTPIESTATDVSTAQNQYFQQQQQSINDYNQQMISYAKSLSDNMLAITEAYQENYAQALQQVQNLISSESNASVPDSVKVAISQLQETLGDNISQLKDEAAARGISNSGLLQDQETKLQKGELSQEESLYANWLDSQQSKIYSATLQLANMQSGYASNLATLQQNALEQPMQAYMQATQNTFNAQSSLNQQEANFATQLKEWIAQQRQSAAQSAAENEAANAKLQQDWAKTMLPYQYMTQYQQGELQNQSAQLQQDWNTALLPYQYMTQYQQGELSNDAAKLQTQTAYNNARLQLEADKLNLNAQKAANNVPISTQAQQWVNQYFPKFQSPTDMYAQVMRNVESGTMSAQLGNSVLSYLAKYYSINSDKLPDTGKTNSVSGLLRY